MALKEIALNGITLKNQVNYLAKKSGFKSDKEKVFGTDDADGIANASKKYLFFSKQLTEKTDKALSPLKGSLQIEEKFNKNLPEKVLEARKQVDGAKGEVLSIISQYSEKVSLNGELQTPPGRMRGELLKAAGEWRKFFGNVGFWSGTAIGIATVAIALSKVVMPVIEAANTITAQSADFVFGGAVSAIGLAATFIGYKINGESRAAKLEGIARLFPKETAIKEEHFDQAAEKAA